MISGAKLVDCGVTTTGRFERKCGHASWRNIVYRELVGWNLHPIILELDSLAALDGQPT